MPGWQQMFSHGHRPFQRSPDPAASLEQASTAQARAQLTAWLRDQMVNQQFNVEMEFGPRDVPSAIVATARQRPEANHPGGRHAQPLTYRRLLVGADLLAGPLQTALLSAVEPRAAFCCPMSTRCPSRCSAFGSIGKVPAILNYSTGPATMLACCQLAGLKQIITSRAFLERARLNLDPLDRGRHRVHLSGRPAHANHRQPEIIVPAAHDLESRFMLSTSAHNSKRSVSQRLNPQPSTLPHRRRPVHQRFRRRAQGRRAFPRNLLANIRQMLAVTDIMDTDRLFNCLPLFHSFGLTVGLLLPLVRGIYTFVYPSPLHYRVIPSRLLRPRLHHFSQHEHLSQRLRAQGASL